MFAVLFTMSNAETVDLNNRMRQVFSENQGVMKVAEQAEVPMRREDEEYIKTYPWCIDIGLDCLDIQLETNPFEKAYHCWKPTPDGNGGYNNSVLNESRCQSVCGTCRDPVADDHINYCVDNMFSTSVHPVTKKTYKTWESQCSLVAGSSFKTLLCGMPDTGINCRKSCGLC